MRDDAQRTEDGMEPTFLLNLILAVAIPAGFIYLIYLLDLYGTGKFSTVLVCVLWGATGAFALSWFFNNRVFLPLTNSVETVRVSWGPIIEEIAKAMVLAYLVGRPRFRYVVDGAIYGFAVGIGFSITENIFVAGRGELIDTLSRVLSTTLMHATASAAFGIALGRFRRATSTRQKFLWPAFGIVLAMILHIVFNVLNLYLRGGAIVLLVAVGIGAVGAIFIGYQITQALKEEKKRFEQTLSTNVGVSSGERRALQVLGGERVELILKEMAEQFGEEKTVKIRRLLAIQANIGILNGNLKTTASERLKKAWEDEIGKLRQEASQIQRQLGLHVMTFFRNVFPEKDAGWREEFGAALCASDPTQIHQFDLFMKVSAAANTVDVQTLERRAALLQRAEIFRGVALHDLEHLSRAVSERTYRHNDILFNEGDEGDTLYMIEAGQIHLYKGAKHDEKLLRTCNPGEVVGELALIDGSPRSAQARANGELRVLRLRREHFNMFISSRPEVILAVLQFLANRVRETTKAIEATANWATQVSKGNYKAASMLGFSAPSADMAIAGEAPPLTPEKITTSADTAAALPVMLGGAFMRVASILEQREKAVEQTGTHLVGELAELPDPQRKVIQILIRDALSDPRGQPRDLLLSRIKDSGVEAAESVLADLVESGYVSVTGSPDDPRYKASLKRRHRSAVDPLKMWAKPDQN